MATSILLRLQSLLTEIKELDGMGVNDFITSFMPHLAVVSADEPARQPNDHVHAVFSYTVRPEHCNRYGNMHGGAIATLFDFCTSFAMALAPPRDGDGDSNMLQGVSRTLNTTYVRPVPCHTEILVDCELVHTGKRLASVRGSLCRRSDQAVLATCEHGIVLIGPPPSKL